jgi:hypothetical protein
MNTLIRLLVIALGLITFATSSAWAEGLTIPNTFTAGTPAKANEVNQNFSAVAAALPLAWATIDDGKYYFTDSSWVDINTLNIDVPSDGILLITGSVVVENLLASAVTIRTGAAVDGWNVTGFYNGYGYFGAAGSGSESKTMSFTASAAVTAGAHTVSHYFSGYQATQNGAYWIPALNVVFIPAGQGTISSITGAIPAPADDSTHSVQ